MAFLIQANEGADPVILPLGRSVLLIGRDDESNLYLEASEISKNHASILGTEGGYLLKDNGSTNGTIVNGDKVSERRLEHGDTIQFGPYHFRVDLRNPLPETPASMEQTEVKHSGNSYTNLIKLKEIKGAEKSGQLRVAVSPKEPLAARPVVDLPCAGLLATMSADERRILAGLGSMRKANAGSTIVQQGSEMNELILILSGSLEARLEGATRALGRIESGDWIGELNVFDPAGAGCSVVALEDTTYWAISRSNLEGFLSSNQRAGIQLLVGLANTLGKRLRQSLDGAMLVKKPRSVFPWIVASAATSVAILAGIGFFNERQNTGFRVAEMSSLISERNAELKSAQERLRKLETTLSRREPSRPEVRPPQSVQTKQPESPVNPAPKKDAPPRPPERHAAERSVPAGKQVPASASTPVAGGIAYPPEVIVTKKTQVPLATGGVSSGSLTLSEGVELMVLGEEGGDVIVEIGGASKKIPKSNTNFSAALAEAIANPPAPTPTPAPSKKETVQSSPAPKPTETPSMEEVPSGPVTAEDLSQIVGMVKLLNVLEEVQNLKGASKSAVSRFVKMQEPKWEKAAGSASELLGRGEVPQDYSEWLTKFIEASKMFNTVRFPLLEKQLSELDREWVTFQARDAVTKPQSSP